jgi:hypothetical protein
MCSSDAKETASDVGFEMASIIGIFALAAF